MAAIAIWKLTTFCGFYGRVFPYYINGYEGEFKSFHTSTRNPDVEDLEVEFDPELEPITFLQMMSSSQFYYVMGHGRARETYNGKCFFDTYTLYSENGLKIYLQSKFSEIKCEKTWESLESMNQAIVSLD